MVALGSAARRLPLRGGSAPPVPLTQAMAWARPEGAPDRLSDVPGFARALLHETALRTTLPFRIALAGVAVLGVLVLGWTQWHAHRGRLELGRRRAAVQLAEAEPGRFYPRNQEVRQKLSGHQSALATLA